MTDSFDLPIGSAIVNTCGLPGYSLERTAGSLRRSRFDAERKIILVNSRHRDFAFATRTKALQLRHLVRLYVEELVPNNFAGVPHEQLLERRIELPLQAGEN